MWLHVHTRPYAHTMPQATRQTVLMQSNSKTGHPNDSRTKIARGDIAKGDWRHCWLMMGMADSAPIPLKSLGPSAFFANMATLAWPNTHTHTPPENQYFSWCSKDKSHERHSWCICICCMFENHQSWPYQCCNKCLQRSACMDMLYAYKVGCQSPHMEYMQCVW